ncbi:hydrogenase maturation protease [Archaeoglobus sulfaticallidus PM70-1]|uniref:Hydrogenase maturation protease n=1 Tax=Archaeoglobus sulfaticallidus PM70-1 TaxID=387631 RepID=N0BNG5_9EURY|nr:hydrogenase maturation protease [Archaeoglobus sulfaticallidus]AGK62201.1 hydrogenase maturation protease [Archaeoglobus sulfaticallidus PM70-1]
MRVVVLGIGNILLRDEGVGVRVVEELRKLELPDYVEVYDGATLGIALLNLLSDSDKAVIVDAVFGGGKPGDIYRFSLYEILDTPLKNLISAHDIDFVTAFKMGKDLLNLPQNIVVVGIEPKTIEEGMELSDEVKKAIPKAIEIILEEIRGL